MSFLTFVDVTPAGRKTRQVAVRNARHGDQLGSISWYGPWRQYVLESAEAVVWSDGCLTEVRSKIAALNAEQRRALAARQEARA